MHINTHTHLSGYTTFIQECREAAAQGQITTGFPHEQAEGIVIPFLNSTTRDPHRYLYIPWRQIQALVQAQVSLTACALYLILWRLHLIRKSRTVAVTTAVLAEFDFTRHQKNRALACLERTGLIQVER